mgnify:CR=1 FL=1
MFLESKGVGAHLLKVGSKRRRTKQEILESKDEERLRLEGVNRQLLENQRLQRELLDASGRAENNQVAHDVVTHLLEMNLVHMNDEGKLVPFPREEENEMYLEHQE